MSRSVPAALALAAGLCASVAAAQGAHRVKNLRLESALQSGGASASYGLRSFHLGGTFAGTGASAGYRVRVPAMPPAPEPSTDAPLPSARNGEGSRSRQSSVSMASAPGAAPGPAPSDPSAPPACPEGARPGDPVVVSYHAIPGTAEDSAALAAHVRVDARLEGLPSLELESRHRNPDAPLGGPAAAAAPGTVDAGPGWHANHGVSVAAEGSGRFRLRLADGGERIYDSIGTQLAGPASIDRFAALPEGGYALFDAEGTGFGFDAQGRLAILVVGVDTLRYAYDAPEGSGPRLVRVEDARDPEGRRLEFLYGPDGRLTKVRDAAGREASLAYDARSGELLRAEGADGGITEYGYGSGRLISVMRSIPCR